MDDEAIRSLERIAKQTKSDEDILAWLRALIRANRRLPIAKNDWYRLSRVFTHDKKWRTNYCSHQHHCRADARACAKRRIYKLRATMLRHGVAGNWLPENPPRMRQFRRLVGWLLI